MELPKIPLDRETLTLPVELLEDGLTLSWEYGISSLRELARTATLAGMNVLEPGSVRPTEDGVRFTLLNPPLRMGAWKAARVYWDRTLLAPDRVRVQIRGESRGTSLSEVDAEHPLVIPVGRRTDFLLGTAENAEGAHRLRLELDSTAIPPMIFWETSVKIGGTGLLDALR